MLKESETLELKREITSDICKEIISFANSKGGNIYIGYDDNGKLVGVENVNLQMDKISNIISDAIEPNLIFNISIESAKDVDKDIIIIKVLKGTNRPYYLKSKGMTSDGVYLRLGATNRKATRDDIVKMMIEDNDVRFEDNISKEQNLSFNFLKQEFEEKNIILDDIKMKNMGLISSNNLYTNLAYILSDQNVFPIKIAVYSGNSKDEFLDRKDFDNMSIFEQIHEIEKFLNLIIKVPAQIVGMKRVENPEYSIEVIRESLLNTIIHRDYSVYGSTLINIYEDNIEIVNIGGLVGGLTLDAIKKGSSATRNPKLASIFHRLDYVEAYGSGIPRIFSKYRYQKKQPIIETTENSFFITFPKLETEPLQESNKIMQVLYENHKITREDVEKILSCSKSTALRVLDNLCSKNIIKKISIGRKTYYELV